MMMYYYKNKSVSSWISKKRRIQWSTVSKGTVRLQRRCSMSGMLLSSLIHFTVICWLHQFHKDRLVTADVTDWSESRHCASSCHFCVCGTTLISCWTRQTNPLLSLTTNQRTLKFSFAFLYNSLEGLCCYGWLCNLIIVIMDNRGNKMCCKGTNTTYSFFCFWILVVWRKMSH